MGSRGYRVPHTPGGLWELSSLPTPTIKSCISPHVVGGRGKVSAAGRKEAGK